MDGEDENEKKDSTTSSDDSSTTFCLKRSEVTYKSYYFLFFTAIGSFVPYVALYFKQLGLTPSQAGILVGFRIFAELIGSPLWGIVGDKYKARKIILFVSLLSYSAGNLVLLAFQPHNQKCIETTGNKTVVKPLIFTPEGIELGNQEMGLVTGQGVINDSLASNLWQPTTFARKVDKAEVTKLFMIYFGIIVVSSIFGSVVFTMPDALVVGFLQENVSRFGTFRMWGEVGVAFGSFLVGGVIHFSQSEVCGETVKNYSIAFYFCTGFFILAMINVSTLMEVKYQDYESSHNNNILQVVKELLRCRNLIFIVVTCHLGILNGLQENFGLWYLDDLGAQLFMLGLAAGFRYCIAVWGYLSSGTIIKKIGLVPTLAMCLLLYVAVFLGMAFAHNPWLGVVLFSVQGLLYGLGWSTCAVFGGTVSLKVGFHAAVQGIIGGFHWGLGVGTGTTASGVIINHVGIPKTYFIYSMMTVAVLALILLTHGLIMLGKRKESAGEASYKRLPTDSHDE